MSTYDYLRLLQALSLAGVGVGAGASGHHPLPPPTSTLNGEWDGGELGYLQERPGLTVYRFSFIYVYI